MKLYTHFKLKKKYAIPCSHLQMFKLCEKFFLFTGFGTVLILILLNLCIHHFTRTFLAVISAFVIKLTYLNHSQYAYNPLVMKGNLLLNYGEYASMQKKIHSEVQFHEHN